LAASFPRCFRSSKMTNSQLAPAHRLPISSARRQTSATLVFDPSLAFFCSQASRILIAPSGSLRHHPRPSSQYLALHT